MAGKATTPQKAPKTGGDDLDDGLDLDADLVGSADEGEGEEGSDAEYGDADVEAEGDLPVLEDIDAAEGVKRKRDTDGDDESQDGEEEPSEEEKKRRKKAKMKEKLKEKKAKVSPRFGCACGVVMRGERWLRRKRWIS